jgi:hypothetical protein
MRGIAVAVLHCVLVLGIAGKYEFDRQHLPRVWVRAYPVDPTLPVRGRYLSLRVQLAHRTPETVSYFIPEHALDPSSLLPGKELWAEVSVPSEGPPRPIRLKVR